ncbi:MAG: hypothetical protein JW955_08275 [Sedimentisphaerales bacterium]|nr:hypothetical protein [Sedimentisphaerales bacterium]
MRYALVLGVDPLLQDGYFGLEVGCLLPDFATALGHATGQETTDQTNDETSFQRNRWA